MILYKYCPAERVDILTTQLVGFSHRSALNDIFEMRPRVTLDPRMPIPPGATQEEDQEIIEGTLDESLILCLSEAWNIIPMWSYYTKAHTGFVIGFDANHSFFSSLVVKPIQYLTEYPEVNWKVGFHQAIFHKFEQWKHEREWRCFRIVGFGGDPYSHPLGVPNVFLYALPTGAIREIVFGHRMSDSNKKECLKYLSADAYRHVDVYQAAPDPHAWHLERKRHP